MISGVDGTRRGFCGQVCQVVITKKCLFWDDKQQACQLLSYVRERERSGYFQEEAYLQAQNLPGTFTGGGGGWVGGITALSTRVATRKLKKTNFAL